MKYRPLWTEHTDGRVKSRVTGEGQDAGKKITGDDWERGDHVTGTEGASATVRNQSRRGAPLGAMGARASAPAEAPKPVSRVTGSSGNTENRFADHLFRRCARLTPADDRSSRCCVHPDNPRSHRAARPAGRPCAAQGRWPRPAARCAVAAVRIPLCRQDENAQLHAYERTVKDAFDGIVPILKETFCIAARGGLRGAGAAHRTAETRFRTARRDPRGRMGGAVGHASPVRLVCVPDLPALLRRFLSANDPLASVDADGFDGFLQACGFHTLDISPCADGRLAHVVRYVLRLPHRSVRRKSYAGAMFDIENSIEKWVETEMLRYREGRPNLADAPTRYLKAVVYHYSSVDPEHEGCAAHGSDTQKAAQAGLDRLNGFQGSGRKQFLLRRLDRFAADRPGYGHRCHSRASAGWQGRSLAATATSMRWTLYHDTRGMSAGDATSAVTTALPVLRRSRPRVCSSWSRA